MTCMKWIQSVEPVSGYTAMFLARNNSKHIWEMKTMFMMQKCFVVSVPNNMATDYLIHLIYLIHGKTARRYFEFSSNEKR